MLVGIPKEVVADETRVSAVPDTVAKLTRSGISVIVEADAGAASLVSDEEYIKSGAIITADAGDLFGRSDVILKVRGPAMNDKTKKHEAEMMKEGACLIALLQPLANIDIVITLAHRKITAFSLDAIPRISRAQMMDVLSSMSTVAGYKAVLLAANSLKRFLPMLSTAAGTVHPAKTVIIGAGVAGLQSIATAKRLGSVVVAFDTRPATGEQIRSLGAEFAPLDVVHETTEDAGGYAKELSADFYKKEQELIRKHTKDADIVITTALVPGKPAPTLITDEMVKEMKPGSVIVDIVAEQGGNCAAVECGKVIVKHGVTIIGTTNLPSLMPQHASQLYARNILNFLNLLAPDKTAVKVNLDDEILKGSLITHNGEITNQDVKDAVKKGNISYPNGAKSKSHW